MLRRAYRRTTQSSSATHRSGRRLPRTVRGAWEWAWTIAAQEWQGPADLPSSLRMEWRLIAARWVGIAFVMPALPLLHLSPVRLIGTFAILIFATSYNIAVRRLMQTRPH